MRIHFHCARMRVSKRTATHFHPYGSWIMIRGWFIGYVIR